MMGPDTILRSDAIEEIYQAYGRPSDDEVFIRMREALERVPWVSPLTFMTNSKEYEMPDGRTAVFEYSDEGIGSITLESMDMLMSMIADRPQGKWIMHFDDIWPEESTQECSVCHEHQIINGNDDNYCPNCGARMFAKGINVPNKKGVDDGK